MFKDFKMYIVPLGIPPKRMNLFKDQVVKNGGAIVTSDFSLSSPTHVIVEQEYQRKMHLEEVLKILHIDRHKDNVNFEVVSSLWISRCLKGKALLPTNEFKFEFELGESFSEKYLW